MYCTNCNKSLPDNAKFCSYCACPVLKKEEIIWDQGPLPEKRFPKTCFGKGCLTVIGLSLIILILSAIFGSHNDHSSDPYHDRIKEKARQEIDEENKANIKRQQEIEKSNQDLYERARIEEEKAKIRNNGGN